MKRILFALIFALWVPPQAYAVTLKIATLAPDGTSWMKSMRKAAKQVAEKTDGRVKLRFYPGGVMGNDKSVLRKIRVGQLHGGALVAGGLVPIYKDIQIYSLPFLFSSYQEVDHVRKRMDSQLIQGLRDKGFVSFGITEAGFAYLLCQSPITTPDDMRKRKVWSPEGDMISRMAIEALDISPILLPITDVLTGLQTGLIDTVASSPIGAIALQWHTRVKYLTDLPLTYFYGTLVIKEKALNKLSRSDRETLRDILETASSAFDSQSRKENLNARKALQNQGIQFVAPSPQDLPNWLTPVHQAVDEMGQRRLFSPALLKQMRQHLNEYRNSR